MINSYFVWLVWWVNLLNFWRHSMPALLLWSLLYFLCFFWSGVEIKESCCGVKAEISLIRIYYNKRKTERTERTESQQTTGRERLKATFKVQMKRGGAKIREEKKTRAERGRGASPGAGSRGRICRRGRGPAERGASGPPAGSRPAGAWPEPPPPAARWTPPSGAAAAAGSDAPSARNPASDPPSAPPPAASAPPARLHHASSSPHAELTRNTAVRDWYRKVGGAKATHINDINIPPL